MTVKRVVTIRHVSGSGAQPYVAGTLLARQEVMRIRGLVRGVRPAVIFEVVDRLLLLTGHPTTELTPARTNMSFFNCLQQRNQTFQR